MNSIFFLCELRVNNRQEKKSAIGLRGFEFILSVNKQNKKGFKKIWFTKKIGLGIVTR